MIEYFTNTPIIYNKDINLLKKEKSCPSELLYFFQMPTKKTVETYIQQDCKREFDIIKSQHYDEIYMDFMQIDNGGGLANKMKKKCEGTISGASDSQLWFANIKTGKVKIINCEFKRIGTPSQIDTFDDSKKQIHLNKQKDFQLKWQQQYNCKGIITNNKLYFRKIVLETINDLQQN